MAYSDWQLNRLRDALRAYHDHGGRDQAEDFNWTDVAEGIAVEFDLKEPPIAAERLRQFVEGNRSAEPAMRKFGTLKPESLEYAIRFAFQRRLLLPEEIEEPEPSVHAPQRLLEYLNRSEMRWTVTPVSFSGRYAARSVDEHVFRDFDLTLHRGRRSGMLIATKTVEEFDKELLRDIEKWDAEQRRNHCNKRTLYSGWAIFTPEDTMMVFLQQKDNARNVPHFTLAARWYAPGTAADRLFLLRHDYPIELENTNQSDDQIVSSIIEETKGNILVFRRIE